MPEHEDQCLVLSTHVNTHVNTRWVGQPACYPGTLLMKQGIQNSQNVSSGLI